MICNILNSFECRVFLNDLDFYELAEGKTKKASKFEASKKMIDALLQIPEAQQVIQTILFSTAMNDSFLKSSAKDLTKTS